MIFLETLYIQQGASFLLVIIDSLITQRAKIVSHFTGHYNLDSNAMYCMNYQEEEGITLQTKI